MTDPGRLQLDPDEMRASATAPWTRSSTPSPPSTSSRCCSASPWRTMRARLDGPPPAAGRPYQDVLAQVMADVVPYNGHIMAGGYMAFIPGFPTWPSAMGDLIASALMLDACWWAGGAGGTQLELTVLRWFAEWLGYPPDAGGVLVSGGSAANMTALACARERYVGAMRDDLVVYVSAQSHSSVARAARALGFRPEQVRVIPVDHELRMRVDVLEKAVAADRAARQAPARRVRQRGHHQHRRGGPAGRARPTSAPARPVAARGRRLRSVRGAHRARARALAGIERADSVTLDPHKWLFQPFECGAILVREPDGLRQAFTISPDYLRDVAADAEVNFSDRGLQLIALLPRTQGVDVASRRSAWTRFGPPSTRRSTWRARRRRASRRARSSSSLAPVDLSVVACGGARPGRRTSAASTPINLALVAEVEKIRRGAGVVDPALRAHGDPHVRPQPHDHGGPRAPRAGHHRADAARGARPRRHRARPSARPGPRARAGRPAQRRGAGPAAGSRSSPRWAPADAAALLARAAASAASSPASCSSSSGTPAVRSSSSSTARSPSTSTAAG